MTRILTAALCLMANGALACPTAADMTQGVRFTLATDEVETFRLLESGIIQGDFFIDETDVLRTFIARGIYLVETYSLQNGVREAGTRFAYAYPVDVAQLPAPTPGGGWAGTVVQLEGTNLENEAHDYRFGAQTTQSYGACTYQMIPVTVLYPDDVETNQREVLHYLPELGLSYLAEFSDKDYDEVYSYTQIEVIQ
ncbi:MAG: hypothetical protein AB8B51_00500 [Sedimentitalea sp.]